MPLKTPTGRSVDLAGFGEYRPRYSAYVSKGFVSRKFSSSPPPPFVHH